MYLTGIPTFSGSAPLTFTQPVTLDTTAAAVTLTVNNSTTFSSQVGELGIAHSLSLAGPGTLTLLGEQQHLLGGHEAGHGHARLGGDPGVPGKSSATTPLGYGTLS